MMQSLSALEKAAEDPGGKPGRNGKKVAMIEKSDKMYGGTCINVGCIHKVSREQREENFSHSKTRQL